MMLNRVHYNSSKSNPDRYNVYTHTFETRASMKNIDKSGLLSP